MILTESLKELVGNGISKEEYKQILEIQEKAEKWDRSPTSHIIVTLEQENKQLKEEVQSIKNGYSVGAILKENDKLKEEYELLLGRPFRNESDIGKLKQNIINDKSELKNLKQKLEKIEEYFSSEFKQGTIPDWLKEILKERE